MVSSSSAAAQAAENEKRKKQTMEKVKVNHLSRQLQMRLQYARLKVEHGWQKQNLNEVENLYFHNSHLRGSKTYPVPTIVTTQPQPPPFPPPQVNFSQSRLSFRYGPTPGRNSISGPSILGSEPSGPQTSQDNSISNDGTKSAAIADHPNSTTNMDASIKFNAPEEPSGSTVIDLTQTTPSLSFSSTPASSMPAGPSESASTIPDDHATTTVTDSTGSPQDSQSPTDVSQSSNNHYPAVKPVRPRSHKASTTSRALPSLTARDMFNFGSSSTLTYDSFWSSHSGSTTPRPTRGASASSVVGDFAASFQIPGDFASGIHDQMRSSSIFAPSSSTTPTPTYLEIPRNPGGPI